MIHLFLDDSGKESQSTMPYVCMAGYLAGIEAIVSLNQKWQQAAGLLAWETRKELMQKREGHSSTRRWRTMFTQLPNYHLQYAVGERWDDKMFETAPPQIMEKFSSSGAPSVDREDAE